LKVEKGEDPYEELKSELNRRKQISYKPMLKKLKKRPNDSNITLHSTHSQTMTDILYKLRSIASKSAPKPKTKKLSRKRIKHGSQSSSILYDENILQSMDN
jgi:hypothetical protein